MKTKSMPGKLMLAGLCLAVLIGTKIFAPGSDYVTNDVVLTSDSTWPKGMAELVRSTNWVHGFWVNDEDIFFFSGSAANFSSFLEAYSQVQSIEKHVLILDEGVGEAKSPWDKSGPICDWKLYGCRKGWLNVGRISGQGTNSIEVLRKAAKDTNYVLEVHFWTGGKIKFDQVKIPKNIEVTNSK